MEKFPFFSSILFATELNFAKKKCIPTFSSALKNLKYHIFLAELMFVLKMLQYDVAYYDDIKYGVLNDFLFNLLLWKCLERRHPK
jgi:hypothetical protein